MAGAAIRMQGITKRYDVFDNQRSRLLHALAPRYGKGVREVWALRGVDLEVGRGESVAVIGRNGSGKSTLLQILTGVLAPTAGELSVDGRVSALLELGSGFNPEYTGRDNVVLNGLLLGLARRQILDRFDEIAEFADIGEAIDRPVKTYSSGMLMRLAFAVQVLTDPEILVVDEALSVGDFFFQQKCYARVRALCEKGVTLVFVSHDMAAVRDVCTRGILLQDGAIAFAGDKLEAIRRYLSTESHGAAPVQPFAPAHAVPPGGLRVADPIWRGEDDPQDTPSKGRLLAVGVFDGSGAAVRGARIGGELVFRVLFRAHTEEPLHVNIVLKNRYGQVVTVAGSYTLRTALPPLRRGEEALFELTMCPLLEAGSYSFEVVLGQAGQIGNGVTVDQTPTLGPLHVTWDYQREVPPFYGMVGLQSAARFMVAGEG